jgi:hypothetical protein
MPRPVPKVEFREVIRQYRYVYHGQILVKIGHTSCSFVRDLGVKIVAVAYVINIIRST